MERQEDFLRAIAEERSASGCRHCQVHSLRADCAPHFDCATGADCSVTFGRDEVIVRLG